MLKKCDNCNKNITKSAPGLECSKCERIMHLSTKCTGLTNKQIAALKVTSSLEWTCLECQKETPRRSSSIIIPENGEEDDDDNPVEINAKKLLSGISIEVEKAIKKEMRELHESMQFQSAKLDEVVECMEVFKQKIKELERKNTALTNKNMNLEVRLGAMEQRLQELEQEKLGRYVEISNVSNVAFEEVKQVTDSVASFLKQSKNEIKSTRKLQGHKDQAPKILVELQNEEAQERWIMAGKNIKISVADIHPSDKNNHQKVYVREAMTKSNKHLFWNVKQELKIKQEFKYVWFKKGYIRARRDDNEKIFIIKNMDDLQAIINNKL